MKITIKSKDLFTCIICVVRVCTFWTWHAIEIRFQQVWVAYLGLRSQPMIRPVCIRLHTRPFSVPKSYILETSEQSLSAHFKWTNINITGFFPFYLPLFLCVCVANICHSINHVSMAKMFSLQFLRNNGFAQTKPCCLCHPIYPSAPSPSAFMCACVHQTIDFRLIYSEFMGARCGFSFVSLWNDRIVISSTSHTK